MMDKKKTLSIILSILAMAITNHSSILASEAKQSEIVEYIVPAPGKIKVDGDLKDWDKSRKIGPVTFDEESIEEYNATFYATYDKENFYVAAVIVEPHPPYNTNPLKGVGSWDGDAVCFRMSSDPTLPLPLQGMGVEQQKSDALFTASLWYNHLNKKDYWDAYYSVEKSYSVSDYTGLEVKTLISSDEHGYTLEAKIPWKIINPKFQPKPGDRIALTWEVSIADMNPSNPKRAFQIFGNGGGVRAFTDPSQWGVAEFK